MRCRRSILALPLLLLVSCASAFQPAKLQQIDAAVDSAIAQKRLPGGVLLVEHDGQRIERVYGNRALVPAVEKMTADTIFDAASITKSVATAPSIAILVQRGKIDIDAPVQRYLPEFNDGGVTVRHLLTHSSGLPPSLDLSADWSGYDGGVRRALATPLTNRPGFVFRYSDINYILLGEIVRRVSGEPLDVFAKKNVLKPLGMHDSGFRPSSELIARIAPTEDGLRGVVHDPTSRRMGGVAGHAGLFTTANDMARFCGAVLRATQSSGGDELTRALRSMTVLASPPEVAIHRTAGFDLDSNYSRPRGDHFSPESFGHTGWTGGFFWIDPPSDTFYIFLSNRVHPDGKGSVVALQHELGNLVAESLRGVKFAPEVRRVRYLIGGDDALNGIDVLQASGYEMLRGKRVGLVTNRSAIDRFGNPTVDLLRSARGVTVAAIFTPEHGLGAKADERVSDEMLGPIPVFSLYGERKKPTREQLAGLDALVFDIQDIGTRFYTYISTMGLAMEAASEAKVKFIVLDRVNPIGGEVVEGPLLEGEPDFVAWHPLPIRHGMTVGELAKMFNEERHINADVSVVPVKGWMRPQWQDEAGLPWIDTSPNMRSLTAAGLYPGLGLLERALSVGRGTPTPFEIVGAPYIDGARLAAAVHVPGVTLTPVRFTPAASTHRNEQCGGVRIVITDRRALRSVDLGIAIATAVTRLYPEQFPLDELQPLLRHRATLQAIREGKSLEEIHALWNTHAFEARRARYLLY